MLVDLTSVPHLSMHVTPLALVDSEHFCLFSGTWLDTLELHNQVLLGVGICLGLLFLFGLVYCCRKLIIRTKLSHSEADEGDLSLMVQDSL